MASKFRFDAAFQGEEGAFSHEAVKKLCGEGATVLPCPRFEDVFRAVTAGRARSAVIPIENTLHGSVHENYGHLLNFDLRIAGETNVRIVHNLIAPPGLRFEEVRRVYSHPVALNQCLRFFAANPQLEREPFYDTAGSVKMIMTERPPQAAAIASAVSAGIYGASILKRSIEDDRQNFTRFFHLMPQAAARRHLKTVRAAEWKTSLVFSTPNVPGSLYRVLSAFALRDLSLTKIESRPILGKPFEYLFYLDFAGSDEDPKVRRALAQLEEFADFHRILGCYPRGDWLRDAEG